MNRTLYVNYTSMEEIKEGQSGPGIRSSCSKDTSFPAVTLATWASWWVAGLGAREGNASFLQEASILPSGARTSGRGKLVPKRVGLGGINCAMKGDLRTVLCLGEPGRPSCVLGALSPPMPSLAEPHLLPCLVSPSPRPTVLLV